MQLPFWVSPLKGRNAAPDHGLRRGKSGRPCAGELLLGTVPGKSAEKPGFPAFFRENRGGAQILVPQGKKPKKENILVFSILDL